MEGTNKPCRIGNPSLNRSFACVHIGVEEDELAVNIARIPINV